MFQKILIFSPHYHLKLDSIDVADTVLELPPNAFEGGVVFDSGATFSYLPEKIYKATMIVVLKIIFASIFALIKETK